MRILTALFPVLVIIGFTVAVSAVMWLATVVGRSRKWPFQHYRSIRSVKPAGKPEIEFKRPVSIYAALAAAAHKDD